MLGLFGANFAGVLEGAGAGFLVGVFCPAVARKVKSWFSSESKKLIASAKADLSSVAQLAATAAQQSATAIQAVATAHQANATAAQAAATAAAEAVKKL